MTDTETTAAAGVLNNVIDNLKGSPLIIGLLCLNGLFLAVIAWLSHESSTDRHAEMLEMMRDCNRPQAYYPPTRGGLEEMLNKKEVQ